MGGADFVHSLLKLIVVEMQGVQKFEILTSTMSVFEGRAPDELRPLSTFNLAFPLDSRVSPSETEPIPVLVMVPAFCVSAAIYIRTETPQEGGGGLYTPDVPPSHRALCFITP